jgi:MerR family transcriptional regulator, light-induced transcriptional regulator
MNHRKGDKEARHPIGVVSRRTGIPQDLIRAWERRYGAVVPRRTDTGRRFYTDSDVHRLLVLKRLVDGGRRISDVAALDMSALESLLEEDRQGSVAPLPAPPLADEGDHLEIALDAVARMDAQRLERVLVEASLALSAPDMREKLLTPLLDTIGHRWREGGIRVAHEHMASSVVRAFLDSQRSRSPGEAGRPRIVIGTPAGQRHELGALMAAGAAEEVGWEAVYLGASLPPEEIASAVRQVGARAVAISIIYGQDNEIYEQLRQLSDFVGREVPLIIGGRATADLNGRLEALGVYRVGGMTEFQSRLDTILGRKSSS